MRRNILNLREYSEPSGSVWQVFGIVFTGWSLFSAMEDDLILGLLGSRQLSKGRRLPGKEDKLHCTPALTLALPWSAAFFNPRSHYSSIRLGVARGTEQKLQDQRQSRWTRATTAQPGHQPYY